MPRENAGPPSQGFRPLAPSSINPPRPPPPSAPTPKLTPRARQVAAACDPCKKSKAKCSGHRPKCRRCEERELECEYATHQGETNAQALKRSYGELHSQNTKYRKFFRLLGALPDDKTREILRHIKTGAGIDSVMNQITVGSVSAEMAVSPETRLRYTLPYRVEMPSRYLPDNPYLASMLYEATSVYPVQIIDQTRSDGFNGLLPTIEHQHLYTKPFHSAIVVEPRLSDLKISRWTSICDNDEMMQDLLRVFFRCEYHFTAAFHKDYFLEDMASMNHDFCSPLLVNVVLAYACTSHPRYSNQARYWDPDTYVYRFLAEAKRLWELESFVPRITTIQAGILFSVIHNLCGLDRVGQPYRIKAVALAQEIDLLHDMSQGTTSRRQRGRAFTAWALYNWETLSAFSFLLQPLLTRPPTWELPDPTEDSDWYGEVWMQYPQSLRPLPSYFGLVFKARSAFRIIMNEYGQLSNAHPSAITIEKALLLHLRLKAWLKNLPPILTANRIVLPGHLQLHIYYYHLTLTIFEPLDTNNSFEKASFQNIIQDSKRYILTLVRLYFLRHGFEAVDLFICVPLMILACDCLDAIMNLTPSTDLEELRSTLMLVANGLYHQRKNHYLSSALYRVVLSRMRPVEVSLLKEVVDLTQEEEEEGVELVQAVRSAWPVRVVKSKDDLDTAMLGNLVDDYMHMRIW